MISISNVPNEILLNLLLSLDRNEIEKCQLVCQKFKNLVNANVENIPLRRFYSLAIGKSVRRNTVGVGAKDVIEIQKEKEGNENDKVVIDLANLGDDEKSNTPMRQDDVARIKALKYVVFEECRDLMFYEDDMLKTVEKLHHITRFKINIVRFFSYERFNSLPTIASHYFNISSIKATLEVDKFEPDNFFTNPPVIPRPLERISLILEIFQSNIYNQDIDLIRNLSLFDAPRYSITLWWVSVGFEFFKNLHDWYLQVDPKMVPKKLKIRNFKSSDENSDHDQGMSMAVKDFVEFLKSMRYPMESEMFESYKCKNGLVDGRTKHTKEVYVINKTSDISIKVEFYKDDDNFTCFIKFVVELL